MSITTIATLNTAGLASPKKRKFLDKLCHSNNIDLCLLQESNLVDDQYTMEHGIILGSPPLTRHAGLAFWHRAHLPLSNINILDIFKDIVQEISFWMNDEFYVCYNIHLPHDDTLIRQVLNFWKERLSFWGVFVPELEQGDSKNINFIDIDNLDHTHASHNEQQDKRLKIAKQPIFFVLGDFNMELERDDEAKVQWKRATVRAMVEAVLTAMSVIWLSIRLLVEDKAVTRGNKIIDYICIPRCWSQNIHSMKVIEQSNSDHSLISACILLHTGRLHPPYWRMKNQILDSKSFVASMNSFLTSRTTEAPEDSHSFIQWWDTLKSDIIIASKICWRDMKRKDIVQEHTVKDTPSSNNFKSFPSKILFLKEDNGNIISEDAKIMDHVKNFYTDLFNLSNDTLVPPENMTFGLNKIDASTQIMLEEELTQEDLLQAAGLMNLEKAPGADGITLEFYLKFWPLLGPLIFKWFQSICIEETLSGSAATGIITLIPKKGDLRKIDNWRPISLLSVELKIVLKALAVKLTPAIRSVIPSTQTSLPGSSIFESLATIRDVISINKFEDKPLFILTLDQSKAFDRVSHSFLFHLLRVIGIPLTMIKIIKSFYTGFECRVKNVNLLSKPFSYARGIRQGDSTSTILYALAMQPFLNAVHMALHSEGIWLTNDKRVLATAYADDVSFFVRNIKSISIICETFHRIATYSEAVLNLHKSAVLALKIPKERKQNIVRDLHPLTVSFKSQKILGIVFSSSLKIDEEQWTKKMSSTKFTIVKNMKSIITMTYMQRAMWAKKLLWPRWSFMFKVLQPSKDQIHQLTILLSEAVWANSKHWLTAEEISEDKQIGGLEAISPQRQIDTFRIAMLAQLYMANPNQTLKIIAERIFNEYTRGNIGLMVLHSRPDNTNLNILPLVYQAALLAWDKIQICIFPQDLQSVLALPAAKSRLLLQLEDPIDISYAMAKDINIITIGDLYHRVPGRTRWHKNIHETLRHTIDNWILLPPPEGIVVEPKRDFNFSKPTWFFMAVLDQIIEISSWTNKIIAKALKEHNEINRNEEVPSETWKLLFSLKAPATFINQTWKCFHLCVPPPSYYYHSGIRDTMSCIFCRSPDTSFEHQFQYCNVLELVIKQLQFYMKALQLTPLTNQWHLYPFPINSHRLANFLIVAYFYTIILVTRTVANSEASISSQKFLSIYLYVITRHLKIYADKYPPSNHSKRFKWDVYT